MSTTFTIPQLAAAVRQGQPGVLPDFLKELQPHMERMLRRALRGRGNSPLDAKLRQAAATGDFERVTQTLCRGSAARLQHDPATTSPHQGTLISAAAWTTDTAVV